jgi:hypothetical protein
LSSISLLLLKLDQLGSVRRGVTAKVLGGKPLSAKRAFILKIAMVLLYIGIAYLIPLFTLDRFGDVTEFGKDLARFHHLIINGSLLILFYFGLFVGANLIYESGKCENEQLLAYPIVMEDLIQYRVMDVLIVGLKSCLYVFSPFMLLIFLAINMSTIWTIAMTILATVFLMAVFLLGVCVLLSIAKRMPHYGPDRIFIGIFLLSAISFAIAVRLFKTGFYSPENLNLWVWLEHQLSLVSISSPMDNMALQPWGFLQYALSLTTGSIIVLLMSKMCVRSFGQAFCRIHIQANDMTMVKRNAIRPSFATLNRYFRFLPLDIRTILTKDVLALVRRPNLLIKAFFLVIVLALATNWKYSYVAEPSLFVLYFSSTLLISRLFINTIGQERNNILVIKQLVPSISQYLSARARITVGVSLFVLLPYWVILIGISRDLTLLGAVWRLPLLLLNVIVSSLLVTWYSATFAEFDSDSLRNHDIGINPVAMLIFWGFSILVSLYFYKLDSALLAHRIDNTAIFLIVIIGAFLVVSMAVFRFFGIRRIKQYA